MPHAPTGVNLTTEKKKKKGGKSHHIWGTCSSDWTCQRWLSLTLPPPAGREDEVWELRKLTHLVKELALLDLKFIQKLGLKTYTFFKPIGPPQPHCGPTDQHTLTNLELVQRNFFTSSSRKSVSLSLSWTSSKMMCVNSFKLPADINLPEIFKGKKINDLVGWARLNN